MELHKKLLKKKKKEDITSEACEEGVQNRMTNMKPHQCFLMIGLSRVTTPWITFMEISKKEYVLEINGHP